MARGSGWFSRFGRGHDQADVDGPLGVSAASAVSSGEVSSGESSSLKELTGEASTSTDAGRSSPADDLVPGVEQPGPVADGVATPDEPVRPQASAPPADSPREGVDVSRETPDLTNEAESSVADGASTASGTGAVDGQGGAAWQGEVPRAEVDVDLTAVGTAVDTGVLHAQESVDNDVNDGAEPRNHADLPVQEVGDNVMQASTEDLVDGEDDAVRRAELIAAMPEIDDSTPLAAELAQDVRRRIALEGTTFPRPDRTRILTVANQKGGVGKTTSTVNLAAALAKAGLNVLVIDNDPQGNASTALGVDHHSGTPSIYEVLIDDVPIAEVVQRCPDIPSLWCVPATIDLSGAEIELVSVVSRETRLRRALDEYLASRVERGEAPLDYVFVDCPPSLGLLTVNAFVVGREVLIPIQCEYYALEGLTQLLKTIALIQSHLNPELHVSTILLTMYDGRTNLAQQVAEEVRSHFPEQTLKTTVPRSVRISEAPSYGQTIMTYDPSSSGALAYLEAAREITDRHPVAGRRGDPLAQAVRSDTRQES